MRVRREIVIYELVALSRREGRGMMYVRASRMVVGCLESKRIPESDGLVGEASEDYDGKQSEVKRECSHVVSIQLAHSVAVV